MSADTDQYTLKVGYTGGGQYFALHWWTYDERGHLILAPTEAKVREIAARVFDEHSEVELKAYLEIEVVGPPNQLRVLAIEHHMREQVDLFHRKIVWRMREAMQAGKTLPMPFAPCLEYRFKDEESENDAKGETDGFRLEHHYDCAACTDGVRLVGMTPHELFATYHQRWEALHPHPCGSYRSKGVPVAGSSQALEAVDGEPLWFVYSNFGDHAGGLELREVDYDNLGSEYQPDCVQDDRVVFYFRRLRDLDLSELTGMRDASDAALQSRQERLERARTAKREQEERKGIEDVISFFGAGMPMPGSAVHGRRD